MIVQITQSLAVHVRKFIAFFLTASLAAKSMLSDYQNRKLLERPGEPPVIIRGSVFEGIREPRGTGGARGCPATAPSSKKRS